MLTLKDVSFSYRAYEGAKSEKVLSSVSLEVKEKENILILGRPESGKTTLSMVMSSLTPRFNDGDLEGSVLLDGNPFLGSDLEKLTLVPQNTSEYILHEDVTDEVAFPLESLCIDKGEMLPKIEQALRKWGLWNLREAGTSCLSGGEKRRLMLACAEISEPKAIIYDESFDDLDASYRERLRGEIASRKHASVVFASHHISYFCSLFDEIYSLESGCLRRISESDAEKLYGSVNIRFARKTKISGGKAIGAKGIKLTRERKRGNGKDVFCLDVGDFELKRGEVVSLRGPNGSGKSTFSRLLCGLDEKESGVFSIDGKDASRNILKRSVGYMFQNPDWQIFLPRVEDELMYSLSFTSLPEKEKECKVDELASLFGLELSAVASTMSFGARKRLQCAIYHSLSRPYYILDELDSALGYAEAARMLELLSSTGAGILVISHDDEFSSAIASRGYAMDGGVMHEE